MTHSWAFRARFRKAAFGWKGSKLAIERIHDALSEIRSVARFDPTTAAEGAVIFLEKLSPALAQVDSSSGALGSAAYAAVLELVPVIGAAPVGTAVRQKWLERLFDAIQDDDPPYIESLGDHWGELCATAELASQWADSLLSTQRQVLRDRARGAYAFFKGTSLCYSALFKAARHDELLELLALDPRPHWQDLIWGARVLAARSQIDEAITYLTEGSARYPRPAATARFAEDLLLKAGRRAEAFDRYALLANQANSNLSTFRALAKKYPELSPQRLLDHLMESTPSEQGKWFATAKTLKLFDRATELAWASPCDPKTLTRAARDHLTVKPSFAMQCALAAMHWISCGHGYEITAVDLLDAHRLARDAAASLGQDAVVQTRLEQILAPGGSNVVWMRKVLGMATS